MEKNKQNLEEMWVNIKHTKPTYTLWKKQRKKKDRNKQKKILRNNN